MKVSRLKLSNKEKITMKRMLLAVAAAVMFLSTLAVPIVAHADGGGAGGNCGGTICKP
jgi:hypothetical protein